jgi:hypothetical protein
VSIVICDFSAVICTSFSTILTPRQINPEGFVYGFIGADEVVIHLNLSGLLPKPGAKLLKIFQILFSQSSGIHEHFIICKLKVTKLGQPAEWELNFFRGKQMKQDHLMPFVPQMSQRTKEGGRIIEEVRKHDDHSTAFQMVPGKFVPDRCHARFASRGRLFERRQQLQEVF